MLLPPFLRQCRDRPEALALAEDGESLSYQQLLVRVQAVAAVLRGRGIGPGARVAIHLERGSAAVAAVFGVLLAGACYVPLDVKNPPPRRAFIIRDAAVAAVVGAGSRPDWLEGLPWLELPAPSETSGPDGRAEAGDPAAILYTSGSTGRPKGVVLSHGAVAAFAEWAAERVALAPEDRIAASAPLFFDLSTFDLYAVLGRGASLHLLPPNLTLAPSRLSAWLRAQAISGWYTVPSLLAFLAWKGNLAATPLPQLRFVLFAGEVFPTPALMDLAAALPATRLFNLFGPTETNVCCCWPVERARLDPREPIPIGGAAAGAELRIDPESGELWVRGPALASGYWQDGGLHPLPGADGWYPTGDRVSRNDRGELCFHGRLGRMLKCAGYRVEPAEIEAVVHALPGVKACAVVGVDDPAGGQRPGLVLVLEVGGTVDAVRQSLHRYLPAYMQPGRCRVVEVLPQLPNGKLDYRGLQTLLEEAP
jgi:amino acid adenylation domain-containing protein